MCAKHKKLNSHSEILKFTYPKLHTGDKWYVDFYAFDPADGSMRRKKFHLDNIEKSVSDASVPMSCLSR